MTVGAPTEPDRDRLGKLIEKRRKELGLSLAAAARAADGIDRATWTGAERGTKQTEEYVYASIERALRWAPGSIEAVLAGGEPTVLAPTVDLAWPAPREIDLDYELDRIERLDIPPRTKIHLAQRIVTWFEQMQAEQKRDGRSSAAQ